MNDESSVKEQVREQYARAAQRVSDGSTKSACCEVDRLTSSGNSITSNLYEDQEIADLPAGAIAASLGCGNPAALSELKPGEVVLDLRSGGGIDVLLSARRVGPSGKAYGLDMTDEMLTLARENQRKARVENVEFLKGEIGNIPLPDDAVDVIISNCVINLSADKDRVFAEAFRVLKPGGRLPFRISLYAARCQPRSGGASSSGRDASPAHSLKQTIAANLRAPGSATLKSNPLGSIRRRIRAIFFLQQTSMSRR